ncbi:MAG: hypothetical protein IPK76_00770 [Lewinellaceae bacterium]|nr:hypothetical protein [Lewinellaceae bacterium]
MKTIFRLLALVCCGHFSAAQPIPFTITDNGFLILNVVACDSIPSAGTTDFQVSIKDELIYNALISAEFFKNRQVTIDVKGRSLTVR